MPKPRYKRRLQQRPPRVAASQSDMRHKLIVHWLKVLAYLLNTSIVNVFSPGLISTIMSSLSPGCALVNSGIVPSIVGKPQPGVRIYAALSAADIPRVGSRLLLTHSPAS